MVVMFSALALLAPSAAAAHEPGVLDQSFSGDGFTVVDFNGYVEPMEIFPNTDGGFTVVGDWVRSQYQRTPRPRLALARFNVDGSLDRDFGTDGVATPDPGFRGYDAPAGWDQAANGDLLVAGRAGDQDGYYLMRLDSSGRRVRTFGDQGMLVWTSPTEWNPTDLRLLPDGRILVLGWTQSTGIIRAHNADGSIDSTFGDQGTVQFNGNASDLYLQSNDRLLVTGYTSDQRSRFVVRAFHLDGRPDRSFGNRGRAVSERLISTGYLWTGDVIVMASGHIAVVGTTIFGAENSPLFLVRFTADGELDSSLGNGTGRVDLQVPAYSWPYAVTELPGGRLAIVGNLPKRPYDDDSRDPRKVFVAAVNNDGSMWNGFAEGGYFTSYFGQRRETNNGTAAAVIDGALVVAGTSDRYVDDTGKLLVARFHLD